MTISNEKREAAIRHLRKSDPVMSDLIRRAGPFTLKVDRDRFGMLVRSIVSQQISTSAARTIRMRLIEMLKPDPVSASAICECTDEELKSVGLSRQKITYLKDLSNCVMEQRVRLDRIARRSDEEIIEELIQVKGIGRWTAQMFLIFSLGRLDVFPFDDLVVRSSIKELYGFEELPSKKESHEIAEKWRPYSTVASWYCWRFVDVKEAAKIDCSK